MTEKTDLQKEAKKLGLDDSGTTANLKARLAAFAKQTAEQEAAAKLSLAPVEEPAQPTSVPDDALGADAATVAPPIVEDTVPNDFNIGVGRTDKGYLFGTSNRFSIGASERYGLQIVGIGSTNHVGPLPLVIPASELPELAALLARIVEEE